VDLANQSYQATVYSLGNPDRPAVNEIADTWEGDIYHRVYPDPIPIGYSATLGGPLRLVGWQSPYYGPFVSTRYYITTDVAGNNIVYDFTKTYTDLYGNSGSPFWMPIDVNAGTDLWRQAVPNGMLTENQDYWLWIKSRHSSLDWSEISNPRPFNLTYQQPEADFFVDDSALQVNTPIQFIEDSVGEATSFAWDFESDDIIDSTERDPVWIFTNAGEYDVNLAVVIEGQVYTVNRALTILPTLNDDSTATPSVTSELLVYPNPCVNSVKLSVQKNVALGKVNLYNLKGQLVQASVTPDKAGRQVSVQLDDKLAAGIYLLKYTVLKAGKQYSGTRKILVK
jgi:hypothetical protein